MKNVLSHGHEKRQRLQVDEDFIQEINRHQEEVAVADAQRGEN